MVRPHTLPQTLKAMPLLCMLQSHMLTWRYNEALYDTRLQMTVSGQPHQYTALCLKERLTCTKHRGSLGGSRVIREARMKRNTFVSLCFVDRAS